MAAHVGVIVTCMGRLEQLRRTLPAVLRGFDGAYTLVDYSCPERASDWARREHADAFRIGRLQTVEVPSERVFHKARALNAGARHAIARGAEHLCFLDADTLVTSAAGPSILQWIAAGRFLVARGPSLFGFLVVSSADFERAGGFDERIREYGGEDLEMRLKLLLVLGLSPMTIPPGLLFGLPHARELCTRYYTEKSREVSNQRNLSFVRARVCEWTGRELEELGPEVLSLCRGRPEKAPQGQRGIRRGLQRP